MQQNGEYCAKKELYAPIEVCSKSVHLTILNLIQFCLFSLLSFGLVFAKSQFLSKYSNNFRLQVTHQFKALS